MPLGEDEVSLYRPTHKSDRWKCITYFQSDRCTPKEMSDLVVFGSSLQMFRTEFPGSVREANLIVHDGTLGYSMAYDVYDVRNKMCVFQMYQRSMSFTII